MIDPLDITHQYVELLERRIFWEEASDESFRLDFTKELDDRSDGDLYSFFDSVQFGFAFNSQKFSRDVIGAQDPNSGDYDLSTVRSVIADGILTDVNIPGFVHTFAVGDIADPVFTDFLTTPVVVAYRDENGDIVNPEGLYEIEQEETFDVTEDVTAFYLQGNFSGEGPVPYRGNIGVRYVDTEQTNFGWVGEGDGLGFEPLDPQNPQVETSRNYDHVLPSLNLAFDLTDEWVLRFAANKALTRPDPIDMASRLDLDTEDFEGNGGNTLHQANFLDAVRSRDRSMLNAEVSVGNDSTGWCNLANVAFRAGGEFSFRDATTVEMPQWQSVLAETDAHLRAHGLSLEGSGIRLSPMLTLDKKTEQFIGDGSARGNLYLKRTYRQGYEVPSLV